MLVSFAELPWLPPAPDDFASRCRAFRTGDNELGYSAQVLASFALDATQSGALSRALAKRLKESRDVAPLSRFRLGLLSNSTIDLLVDCIPAAGARHGVAIEIVTTPYDQVLQQALDPRSIINGSCLDAVLIAVDHRWMGLERPDLKGQHLDRVNEAVERLATVVTNIRQHGQLPAILQTLAVPPVSLFGSYERRFRGTVRAMIEAANQKIFDLADETGSYVLDTAALAERVGTERWFDQVQWGAYKFAFGAPIAPAYADTVGRLLGAIRGKSRKCLVLDLDNTVWGGAVGDLGVEGIKLGQGSAIGEAFLGVQHLALDLRERGILLAVSSKNVDETARRPFREHTEMVLRETDISVFQANWSDKPSNLEAIARTLNIGLDSLVLLDDNPAERAQVRAALPGVAVPELPEDPSWYPSYLLAAGYFESVAFSNEDRNRATSYASDAQRADVFAKSRDLGEYLESLDMRLTTGPFDQRARQRIAQLVNKTNQFNLTTRRYSETNIAEFESSQSYFTLQARLEDRFSDLGLIAVLICRTMAHEKTWDIDTWLMSCRVLGRKIEEAMLFAAVEAAVDDGVTRISACFIPTAKNGMVEDHYERLGFKLVSVTSTDVKNYELMISDYKVPTLPMQIIRTE